MRTTKCVFCAPDHLYTLGGPGSVTSIGLLVLIMDIRRGYLSPVLIRLAVSTISRFSSNSASASSFQVNCLIFRLFSVSWSFLQQSLTSWRNSSLVSFTRALAVWECNSCRPTSGSPFLWIAAFTGASNCSLPGHVIPWMLLSCK